MLNLKICFNNLNHLKTLLLQQINLMIIMYTFQSIIMIYNIIKNFKLN